MHQAKSWNLGWHGIAVTGTPLHVAVSCRNVEAVRALLSIGADINYRVHFRSPLDIAVAFHLPDICELLIERGATVGKYWVTGRSPLHGFGDSSLCPSYGRWMIHGLASVDAAAATIQLLIDHGLDIETEDIKGATSLSIAVRDRAQDLSDTKALLYAYQNLGLPVPPPTIFTEIESSYFTNSCSKITELAEFNLDLPIHDSNSNTLLHHCVIKGATAALRELITYPNINLDIQNQSGFTPLHLACKMNSLDCLEILCANGASINEQVARSKDVALSLSLVSGFIEGFHLLLQSNADTWLGKRTDSSKKPTILHKICDQKLFSQPMNPGFVSSTALPTLHIPPYSLCEQVFKHRKSHILYDLLDRDPMILGVIDERGYTCLHVAIESANLYAIKILLQVGADRVFRDGGRKGESLSKFVDSVRKDMRRWKGDYTDELDTAFDEIGKLIRNMGLR